MPNGRYHGRWKLFGNSELRLSIADFTVFKQKMVFGTTTFFDAGRVWSKLPGDPLLDKRGQALKFGLGGGATLKWGRHFIMRVEAAWSPDASPIGVYLNIGNAF